MDMSEGMIFLHVDDPAGNVKKLVFIAAPRMSEKLCFMCF